MNSKFAKVIKILIGLSFVLFLVFNLVYFFRHRRKIFARLPFFESHTLTVRVCNPFTGNLDILDSLGVYPQEPYTAKQYCEIKEELNGCKIAKCRLLEGFYSVSASGYTGSEEVNLNSDKHIKLDLFGPVYQ